MRNTQQRRIILKKLKKHKDHPGADVIYSEVRKELPNISLGTVYRNLEMLSEKGTILKLEFGSNQKRFDPCPEAHPHFRCLSCGRIEDIPGGMELPPVEEKTWSKGKKITGYNLEFTGYCKKCSKNLK